MFLLSLNSAGEVKCTWSPSRPRAPGSGEAVSKLEPPANADTCSAVQETTKDQTQTGHTSFSSQSGGMGQDCIAGN